MEPTPERQSHARPHETPPVGGDLWARGGLPVERRTGGPAYRPEADRNGLGRFAGGHLSRLFAILLVALLVLYPAACGDAERENAERGDAAAAGTKAGQGTGDRRGAASAKPESDDRDRTARAGGSRSENARSGAGETNARSGEAKADAGSVAIAGSTTRGPAGDARGQTKVALEITGERGAGFSGVCAVGGEERALDGRVPERYVFEPRGKKLECSLSKEDGGALGVVLSEGAGVGSQQWIVGGESTVRIAYSNGGVSSTTTSSVSKSQTVTSSGGSS